MIDKITLNLADSNIKSIFGLGNFGDNYAKTRHNSGFQLLDILANIHNTKWQFNKYINAYFIKITIKDHNLICVKFKDFINRTGINIQKFCKYYKDIKLNNILAIYDDIALPIGKIKYKFSGGHGGHNGIRNIIDIMQDTNFHHLKIGVGHPGDKKKVVDYVLSYNNKDYVAIKQIFLTFIEDSLEYLINQDLNKFNQSITAISEK